MKTDNFSHLYKKPLLEVTYLSNFSAKISWDKSQPFPNVSPGMPTRY